MSLHFPVPHLAIFACALLGLGGCVAVPLAQMAMTQLAQPQPAQPACSGCAPAAPMDMLGNLSKNVTGSFHALTGGQFDNQKVAASAPSRP